jgi:hypothetical protein
MRKRSQIPAAKPLLCLASAGEANSTVVLFMSANISEKNALPGLGGGQLRGDSGVDRGKLPVRLHEGCLSGASSDKKRLKQSWQALHGARTSATRKIEQPPEAAWITASSGICCQRCLET